MVVIGRFYRLGPTLLTTVELLGGCGKLTDTDTDTDADADDVADTDTLDPTGEVTDTLGPTDGSVGSEDAETSENSDGTEDTGEPEPSCDWPAYLACLGPSEPAYGDCLTACPDIQLSCTDGTCEAECEVAYLDAQLACQAQHCTDQLDRTECDAACWTDYSTCIGAPECDLHACAWDRLPCLSICVQCFVTTEFDFAYLGSCELPLPGPLDEALLPYTILEVGEIELAFATLETSCDEEIAGHIVDDVATLCPAVCETFAQVGLARLTRFGPTCR